MSTTLDKRLRGINFDHVVLYKNISTSQKGLCTLRQKKMDLLARGVFTCSFKRSTNRTVAGVIDRNGLRHMSVGPYKRHKPVVSEARFWDVMSVAVRHSVVMTLSGDHPDKVTFNRNRLIGLL
jgi:hypothetical protein